MNWVIYILFLWFPIFFVRNLNTENKILIAENTKSFERNLIGKHNQLYFWKLWKLPLQEVMNSNWISENLNKATPTQNKIIIRNNHNNKILIDKLQLHRLSFQQLWFLVERLDVVWHPSFGIHDNYQLFLFFAFYIQSKNETSLSTRSGCQFTS